MLMSMSHKWRQFPGRVLLLQGPVGPFFLRFARALRAAGAEEVHKVNFNGGDRLFYPRHAVNFSGRPEQWPAFLEQLLKRHKIDAVLLFGDCRPIHRAAIEVAQHCGVYVGVFEEGYVRPNFVTYERYGANGHSNIPRSAEFYRGLPETPSFAEPQVGNAFWITALWAMLYFTAATLLRPLYRHYRHHRRLSMLEGLPWIRSAWRKLYYAFAERGIQARLTGALSGRYFLLPLQVSTDSQVHVHSRYESVPKFIEDVVASFAAHAPGDSVLVVKHHPLDRGYHDYSALIRELAARFGLRDRILYVHDLHLPRLLDHAAGVVLINSTVGMSALFHRAAVKVCGTALYDFAGLTYQGALDDFWHAAAGFRPDARLFGKFRNYLIRHTQLCGSFYRRFDFTQSLGGDSLDRQASSPPAPETGAGVQVLVPAERRAASRVDGAAPLAHRPELVMISSHAPRDRAERRRDPTAADLERRRRARESPIRQQRPLHD